MTRLLESYAAGRWYAASAEGDPLLDAATGDEVARISSAGLDLGEMAHHARTVGGPVIREMTFHERALLLKDLATHLTGLKDEFYEVSLRTGATRRDSMIDIDGGFGTRLLLLLQGPPRAAQRHRRLRRRPRAARPHRRLPRPARLHLTPRRRGADQRLQLPRLGHAREARAGLHRRPALDREARQPDGLPHRARRPTHHRVGHPARGISAAAVRLAPATCSTTSASRTRSPSPARPTPPDPAPAPVGAARRTLPPGRGRLPQLLDPGPRRRRRRPRVGPLRQGRRHRDDRQGRPEVHGDPPGDRARGRRRPGRRGDHRPALDHHRRRPRRRVGADGPAGLPRPARGGPQGRRGAALLLRRRPRRPRRVDLRSPATPSAAPSWRRCCSRPVPGRSSPTTWSPSAPSPRSCRTPRSTTP